LDKWEKRIGELKAVDRKTSDRKMAAKRGMRKRGDGVDSLL
jgi:hypothetical protein